MAIPCFSLPAAVLSGHPLHSTSKLNGDSLSWVQSCCESGRAPPAMPTPTGCHSPSLSSISSLSRHSSEILLRCQPHPGCCSRFLKHPGLHGGLCLLRESLPYSPEAALPLGVGPLKTRDLRGLQGHSTWLDGGYCSSSQAGVRP